jgi:hypothetical protein
MLTASHGRCVGGSLNFDPVRAESVIAALCYNPLFRTKSLVFLQLGA